MTEFLVVFLHSVSEISLKYNRHEYSKVLDLVSWIISAIPYIAISAAPCMHSMGLYENTCKEVSTDSRRKVSKMFCMVKNIKMFKKRSRKNKIVMRNTFFIIFLVIDGCLGFISTTIISMTPNI